MFPDLRRLTVKQETASWKGTMKVKISISRRCESQPSYISRSATVDRHFGKLAVPRKMAHASTPWIHWCAPWGKWKHVFSKKISLVYVNILSTLVYNRPWGEATQIPISWRMSEQMFMKWKVAPKRKSMNCNMADIIHLKTIRRGKEGRDLHTHCRILWRSRAHNSNPR